MPTLVPPAEQVASVGWGRSLLIIRWSAFVVALVTGITAPLMAGDRLRILASEKLKSEEEIRLAVIFGQWFAALSNVLTLVIFSLIVAGVSVLIRRRHFSARIRSWRLIAQSILCVALSVLFLIGALR